MILEVSEFRRRVVGDLPTLVSELQSVTGRFGDEEATSWEHSLPRLARAFSSPGFDRLHLYLNGTSALSLEYQLPAAASWCDVVLLGRGERGPGAVIIELKHWQTHGDYPATTVGLINHLGQAILHPSDQVRGYVEYCRRFHSAVHDHSATINGCVLFTQRTNIEAYRLQPNDELTKDFPCFSYFDADLSLRFLPSLRIQSLRRISNSHSPSSGAPINKIGGSSGTLASRSCILRKALSSCSIINDAPSLSAVHNSSRRFTGKVTRRPGR